MTLIKQSDIHITSTGKELVCTFPLTVEGRLVESRFANLLTKIVTPASTPHIAGRSRQLLAFEDEVQVKGLSLDFRTGVADRSFQEEPDEHA